MGVIIALYRVVESLSTQADVSFVGICEMGGWLPVAAPEKPVIAFAGGKRKVKAVLAALRGHWINGLVTDQTCAQRILATEDKANVT